MTFEILRPKSTRTGIDRGEATAKCYRDFKQKLPD